MCAYVYLRRAGRNDGLQLRYAECDNYLTAKEGQRLQEKLGLVTPPGQRLKFHKNMRTPRSTRNSTTNLLCSITPALFQQRDLWEANNLRHFQLYTSLCYTSLHLWLHIIHPLQWCLWVLSDVIADEIIQSMESISFLKDHIMNTDIWTPILSFITICHFYLISFFNYLFFSVTVNI